MSVGISPGFPIEKETANLPATAPIHLWGQLPAPDSSDFPDALTQIYRDIFVNFYGRWHCSVLQSDSWVMCVISWQSIISICIDAKNQDLRKLFWMRAFNRRWPSWSVDSSWLRSLCTWISALRILIASESFLRVFFVDVFGGMILIHAPLPPVPRGEKQSQPWRPCRSLMRSWCLKVLELRSLQDGLAVFPPARAHETWRNKPAMLKQQLEQFLSTWLFCSMIQIGAKNAQGWFSVPPFKGLHSIGMCWPLCFYLLARSHRCLHKNQTNSGTVRKTSNCLFYPEFVNMLLWGCTPPNVNIPLNLNIHILYHIVQQKTACHTGRCNVKVCEGWKWDMLDAIKIRLHADVKVVIFQMPNIPMGPGPRWMEKLETYYISVSCN